MSFPKDYGNTIRHVILCLYTLAYVQHACAQSYTTLNEKTLYFIPDLQTPQFFSLDLTQSWEAAKAPLELLPTPPSDQPYLYMAALAVNYDKNSLLYFNSHRTPTVYNITTRAWQLGTRLTNPNATVLPKPIFGNQVATDPSNGISYIPSVDNKENFPMYSYNTSQTYNPNVTKTIVAGVSVPYDGYSAVWSTLRKSILFFGGKINGFTPVDLLEFQPSNGQWTSIVSYGFKAKASAIDIPEHNTIKLFPLTFFCFKGHFGAVAPGTVTYPCVASGIVNKGLLY